MCACIYMCVNIIIVYLLCPKLLGTHILSPANFSKRVLRQEYWSGSPFPSPGDLPDPEIESVCPELAGGPLPLNHQGNPSRIFNSVQFSSVTQSCPTLCNPMNRSTPGFPVHHQLPEFTQTHVHRVSDAIQPSHPLSSPSPPAANPSQHQSLFQ